MNWTYSKVVTRYEHVDKVKEVSVTRYLVALEMATPIDIMHQIDTMPDIKKPSTRFYRKSGLI